MGGLSQDQILQLITGLIYFSLPLLVAGRLFHIYSTYGSAALRSLFRTGLLTFFFVLVFLYGVLRSLTMFLSCAEVVEGRFHVIYTNALPSVVKMLIQAVVLTKWVQVCTAINTSAMSSAEVSRFLTGREVIWGWRAVWSNVVLVGVNVVYVIVAVVCVASGWCGVSEGVWSSSQLYARAALYAYSTMCFWIMGALLYRMWDVALTHRLVTEDEGANVKWKIFSVSVVFGGAEVVVAIALLIETPLGNDDVRYPFLKWIVFFTELLEALSIAYTFWVFCQPKEPNARRMSALGYGSLLETSSAEQQQHPDSGTLNAIPPSSPLNRAARPHRSTSTTLSSNDNLTTSKKLDSS